MEYFTIVLHATAAAFTHIWTAKHGGSQPKISISKHIRLYEKLCLTANHYNWQCITLPRYIAGSHTIFLIIYRVGQNKRRQRIFRLTNMSG